MLYPGFGKNSGPTAPPKSQTSFGLTNPFPSSSSSSSSSSVPHAASPSPPRPSDGQKLFYRDLDAPATETLAASSKFQNPQRTRSPPLPYPGADTSMYSNQTVIRNNHSNLLTDDRSQLLKLRSQSPPLFPVNQPIRNFRGPSIAVQQPLRPALASSTLDNRASLSGNNTNIPGHHVQSSFTPQFGSHNPPWSFTSEPNSVQVSKRIRSPPLLSAKSNEVLEDEVNVARKDLIRPSLSPPKLGSMSNVQRNGPHSQAFKRTLPSTVPEAALNRPISSNAPKRTRSPPRLSSADDSLEGNIISSTDDREMLAKAKRLARFKVELSKSEQHNSDIADQKASSNRNEQSVLEQKYVGGHSTQSSGNFTNAHASSNYEDLETSNIIVGLCPDMCPESERAERERKGDLDQYERLDGDRNVTSSVLAVKKYNRTAEREPSLIRPMPILQKTIDYLLNLLDQPYDERFLGMYNFLWDRMRAIRMDLRMQHIFNQGSITMLEQMIRLHIIAMHELCEYTKGEGFSEGFDAHLNIEQMNKTSVELFQMYDDHRKKGINVPTEKEFRGYYALLKLDKHPGYKVEPAELSLDLAKMTPGIRQTPEVLFARNVARACRTGNFIAFFRLARKASYLQACLMHAHFAKLRTQALASLHAGVQNNQGLPVAHVANWLAMEDEDIESLLEYHGFSVKAFEEPYMVKEGPFLNIGNDFATKCSKLVEKKRSEMIIEDVSPSNQVSSMPVETTKEIHIQRKYKNEQQVVSSVQTNSSVVKVDEEMPDSEAILSPKDSKSARKMKEMPKSVWQSEEIHHVATTSLASPFSFSFPNNIPESQPTRSGISMHTSSDAIFTSSPKRNVHSNLDGRLLEIVPKPASLENSIGYSFGSSVPDPLPPSASKEESLPVNHGNEDDVDQAEENDQDEEIAVAKMKLFLRLWRRRALKLRMLREQRQLAANAALDSLSLGPPIRRYIDHPGNFDKFDIDKAMRERYEKQEKSFARLNVSEMVGSILSRRNNGAKCLCWKVILCSQMNSRYKVDAAGSWLKSKLMPSNDYDDDDVVISSPGLTMWKKWIPSESGADHTCCFSIIRDSAFGSVDETISGASAVLFLVSESISWEQQRVQLHNLLMSIPAGAHLPLLVLCASYNKGFSPVLVNELGLCDIDKSRVSGFLLVFLIENQQMEHLNGFFCDKQVREGLEWLAGESPSQPTIQIVKVRELVHTHLNSLLRVPDSMNNSKLSPDGCISAFNEALNCSVQNIVTAAHGNPAGWPCPEIGALDQSSDENRVLKSYLPPPGWSSNAKLEQIVCAFQDCKLPAFPDDLSWLARGSKVGHEIENHRLKLESSLIQYLTDTSKMMGVPLAAKEANVMLQSCARLELRGSFYHIVPQWVMIFRRIFNWRLMGLSSGEVSSAYISECHHVALASSDLDVGFEASLPSPHHLNASLDEIIEVGCNTPIFARDQLRPLQPLMKETIRPCDFRDTEFECNFAVDKLPSINTVCTYRLEDDTREDNGRTEVLRNGKGNTEAERLSKLLEQCNLVQNVIDEKLFLYF